MSDGGAPPKPPLQKYRFRVVTGDGRELISHVATVLKPLPPPPVVEAPPKAYTFVRILAKVESKTQGHFHADAGKLNGYQFQAFDLQCMVSSPRDAQSGQVSGKRMHPPVFMRKVLSKSTPQFQTALATNETLTSVAFAVYGNEKAGPMGGAEVEVFTLKLTNANVATARIVKLNTRDPALTKVPDYEELSFAYETIEWTWKDGGITALESAVS